MYQLSEMSSVCSDEFQNIQASKIEIRDLVLIYVIQFLARLLREYFSGDTIIQDIDLKELKQAIQ